MIVFMTDKKEKKEKKMSIEDLARMMQAGFEGVETRLGGRIDRIETRMENMETRLEGMELRMGSIEIRMGNLELRAFTEEEKEEILSLIHHYDKRLEAETLGKDLVLLTREEYDIFVKLAGIANRFKEEREYA